MYTQVELVSGSNELKVYWLQHEEHNYPPIRVGRGVRVVVELSFFTINRVFTSLKNLSDLPVKRNIATVAELN